MCGPVEHYDDYNTQENDRLNEQRRKRTRAAKRAAAALKAKRRAAGLKAAATRRRNRAKAAKNAKPITVKPTLTVILNPTTQALPAIPRRKTTLTPMKARSLRTN